MIRINKLYENFNSEYNTNQFGFFRPNTDFVPALIEVSLDIFNRLVGQAPKSQKIQDWLMPFLKTVNVSVTKLPQKDIVATPKDYEYYASSRIIVENEETKAELGCDLLKDGDCHPFDEIDEAYFARTTEYDEHSVELVPVNKWSAVTKHVTRGPSMKRPYMKQDSEGFTILPRGLGVVILDYYRKPVDPVFAHKTVSLSPDEYLEFVEAGSVHLEWSETLIPVFLYHLGKRYGLKIHDQLILQVRSLDKIFE